MSGITDSSKFNSTSSYYLAKDPAGGGSPPQTINGSLTVSGNVAIGGNLSSTGDNILNITSNLDVAGTTTLVGVLNNIAVGSFSGTTPVDNNVGVQNTMVIAGYRISWGTLNAGVGAGTVFFQTGTITLTTPFDALVTYPTCISGGVNDAFSSGIKPNATNPSSQLDWAITSRLASVALGTVINLNWIAIAKA